MGTGRCYDEFDFLFHPKKVRKVESRCKGLTRRQNEQELRIGEKEKEIERLVNQERELRRELRNWQQRVFQLEAEVGSIKIPLRKLFSVLFNSCTI